MADSARQSACAGRIGIMQGRLSPPVDGRIQAFPCSAWADEFAAAESAGLACIEWIFDEAGRAANPLGTHRGVEHMRALAAAHGVAVRSLCADLFIERPLLRVGAEERRSGSGGLRWLLDRSSRAGIGRIVLPFVDASAIRTRSEVDDVVRIVEDVLPTLEANRIELHLELSLPPADVAALLKRMPHALVKVNYDSGNSASLGYDPREELDSYGDRIGSVHVKDRVRGGGTVPLGEGDANLPLVFSRLESIGYRGDLILQVARSTSGDEAAWARRNRAAVERLLSGA